MRAVDSCVEVGPPRAGDLEARVRFRKVGVQLRKGRRQGLAGHTAVEATKGPPALELHSRERATKKWETSVCDVAARRLHVEAVQTQLV